MSQAMAMIWTSRPWWHSWQLMISRLLLWTAAIPLKSEATFKGMSIGFANAPGTQGLYYNLSDTSQLPASVVELIRTETSIIDNLTISYIPEYTSWVQTTPPDYQNVEPNTTVDFAIRVTVPEGTTPGFYPFLGTVLGDGAILQLLYFEITVPGSNADLDLDYRPQRDGYSFENFDKKSASYVPLSWAMFQQFFGADQVLHPNGDPIGMAERYYTEHYRDIGDGGHCDGFSSTSMFNHQDLEQTNAGPFELPKHTPLYSVKLGDPGVRDAISFAQGLQRSVETMYYGATMCQVLGGSPNAFFRYTKSLFENNQPAVIAITWYDYGLKKNVSHSLLPYRLVEDQGHNRAYIYVYDSNDPTEWYDSEHRIVINTQADTWEYDVQTLWFIGIKTVSGDSDPCHFTVKPLEPYLHKGVPPWNVVTGAQVLDSNVSEPVYRLFTEYGPARLLFVDDIGQRFGWYNGAFYEEIPSAYYQPTSGGIEDLSGSYLLPEGIDYSLYLFSAGAGEAGIGYWHNNKLLELSNLQLITDTLTAVSISPDEDIITLNAITGTIQTSLVADHLASGEDVYLQIFNLNVEQNGIVNMAFTSPPFELGGGEQITLTTSSPISQIVGLALVRRGGEGYSAFSNASVDLDPSSTAAISVLDWDNIDTITMSVDLDQNGTPDISRTVNNTSQPASVELEASRLVIYPHETVDLTAAVRDQLGIHVNNGVPVIFTTNLGALSTAQGETSAGLVNVSLNPGSQFGTATVTAQVPDTELSATIQIVVLPRTLYLPLLKR